MCFWFRKRTTTFCYFRKMADKRKYKTNANSFCYICGKYILLTYRRNIAHKMKTACKYYFGCKVGVQDKKWAPHTCRNSCNTQVLRWAVGKKKKTTFAVPMIWHKPTEHVPDFYVGLADAKGFSKKANLKLFIQVASLS